MNQNPQVALKPETLAQKTAEEIRERMTEINGQIEAIDAEIAQINSVMMGNWRQAAQNPQETERVAEDLEKTHRRRKLLLQVLDKARADLATAERQIVLDRFAEKRGAFESIMQQRTKRALDVVSTVEMLAAIVNEIDQLGREAIALFSVDAGDAGVTFTEAMKTVNRVHPQVHIETLLGSRIVAGLWDFGGYRRHGPNFQSEYPAKVDAERKALLVELGSAARLVSAGETP